MKTNEKKGQTKEKSSLSILVSRAHNQMNYGSRVVISWWALNGHCGSCVFSGYNGTSQKQCVLSVQGSAKKTGKYS